MNYEVTVGRRNLESIQEQTYYDLCQAMAQRSTHDAEDCVAYFKLAGMLAERGNSEYLRVAENILKYGGLDFNKILWVELNHLQADIDSRLYRNELFGHLINDAQSLLLFIANSTHEFSGLVREAAYDLRRVLRETRPDTQTREVMDQWVAFNKLPTDNLESCYIRKDVVAHSTDFGRNPCPRQWSDNAWKEYSEEYSENARA